MRMLVRGEDTHGHFDLVEPPAAERDAAALAVHQRVSDRYRENYQIQVAATNGNSPGPRSDPTE